MKKDKIKKPNKLDGYDLIATGLIKVGTKQIFKDNADHTPNDTQDPDEKYMSEETFIYVVNKILFQKKHIQLKGIYELEKYLNDYYKEHVKYNSIPTCDIADVREWIEKVKLKFK